MSVYNKQLKKKKSAFQCVILGHPPHPKKKAAPKQWTFMDSFKKHNSASKVSKKLPLLLPLSYHISLLMPQAIQRCYVSVPTLLLVGSDIDNAVFNQLFINYEALPVTVCLILKYTMIQLIIWNLPHIFQFQYTQINLMVLLRSKRA